MIKEGLILLILLTILLGFIHLLYRTGILRRRVVVTIIENLPLGIFKENNTQVKEETVEIDIQENSKSDENKIMECNNGDTENKSENDLKEEFSSESLDMLKEDSIQVIEKKDDEIVYWTPYGTHYHKTKDCRTLLRSKVINSGSIDESGKLIGCHKCN